MDARERPSATELATIRQSGESRRPGAGAAPVAGETTDDRPLIAHVIFRLDFGGLENGLVNLINGLPAGRFRHAIVCIDDYTDFSNRLDPADVELVAIHKRPGTDLSAQWRLYRTFRRLKPVIVHTRNLAALDALLPAWLAGVRRRVHGEHGWDVNDLGGRNARLRWLRRLHAPLVSRYVALSRDLETYLTDTVGIAGRRVSRICNGVDTARFRPRSGNDRLPGLFELPSGEAPLIVGTVGRLQAVKDPLNLIDAFARAIEHRPALSARARLLVVGDGPLREAAGARLRELGIAELCRLVGARDDIPDLMRAMDLFVQPSLAEGISNTVLEAMASGLPVVATAVGGNPELVDEGVTGALVPAADSRALASALLAYLDDGERRRRHGAEGRNRAVRHFSIDAMVQDYGCLYRDLLTP